MARRFKIVRDKIRFKNKTKRLKYTLRLFSTREFDIHITFLPIPAHGRNETRKNSFALYF